MHLTQKDRERGRQVWPSRQGDSPTPATFLKVGAATLLPISGNPSHLIVFYESMGCFSPPVRTHTSLNNNTAVGHWTRRWRLKDKTGTIPWCRRYWQPSARRTPSCVCWGVQFRLSQQSTQQPSRKSLASAATGELKLTQLNTQCSMRNSLAWRK